MHAYDPLVDISQSKKTLKVSCKAKILKKLPTTHRYQLIVLNVPHKKFINSGVTLLNSLRAKNSIIFDIKGAFPLLKRSLSL